MLIVCSPAASLFDPQCRGPHAVAMAASRSPDVHCDTGVGQSGLPRAATRCGGMAPAIGVMLGGGAYEVLVGRWFPKEA